VRWGIWQYFSADDDKPNFLEDMGDYVARVTKQRLLDHNDWKKQQLEEDNHDVTSNEEVCCLCLVSEIFLLVL
tara:strand:+ start:446 stop:664 length:219 start_codon:yes stop_codon:yes gene_type:complete